MTWFFITCILVIAILGGCSVVFGSGRASIAVDRKVEVGSSNDVESTSTKEVEVKDKKQ
jgi:hypothetical protein